MSESDNAYNLLMKGKALLEEGHPAQAAMVLEKARRFQPHKGSILEVLGQAYYRLGQYEKARKDFQHAIEIDPTNDYAQFCLGLTLRRLGLVTEAKGHYKLAIAMNPDEKTYQEMAHMFEEND